MTNRRYPRRLIEVDLLIRQISENSLRENNVRSGRISDLQIWWARRPQAACRAVVCSALWPDPVDELCPSAFREAAFRVMKDYAREAISTHSVRELLSGNSLSSLLAVEKEDSDFSLDNPNALIILRQVLVQFIADFTSWDASTNELFLKTTRELTQAAHESLGGEPCTRPMVVDPFAGGGAIPVESLRVGADIFANDLNQIPVLVNKFLVEYLPKHGTKMAAWVKSWGEWARAEARKHLDGYYANDDGDYVPFAYLWARIVSCEGPGCGTEIPLLSSLWLAKKNRGSVAVKLIPNHATKKVDFEIIHGAHQRGVGEGTVRRGSATCPLCGYTTAVERVRKQLQEWRGGSRNARLYIVVLHDPKQRRKQYRLPNQRDFISFENACDAFDDIQKQDPDAFPDEALPRTASGYFAPPTYGATTFSDLFNPRQLLCAYYLVRSFNAWFDQSGLDNGLREPVRSCVAFVINRLIDSNSSQCFWVTTHGETVMRTFGRQAYPIIWDFAETNPLGDSSRGIEAAVNIIAETIEHIVKGMENKPGVSTQGTAEKLPLPDDSCHAIITDPPYYNSIPYADLADFYQVWMSRLYEGSQVSYMAGRLSPKDEEIVEMASWDTVRYAHKTSLWYEKRMEEALQTARRILMPSGIMVLVFAHKQTTAWEALLSAVVNSGLVVTASWPISTENARRLRAQRSATLQSSIHLVCRPRESSDGALRTDDVGDWRDVLNELPGRIHEWMPHLAQEGVVGADAIFACLGPALEVFSRYSSVEKANGDKVELKEYLEYVWGAVAREALTMIFQGADASGFEEDARLTAMWLWTLRTTSAKVDCTTDTLEYADEEETKTKAVSGYSLEYDAARKIAQGLGAHLERLDHVVEIKGDIATLLSVAARTRYLFGKDAAEAPRPRSKKAPQLAFDFAKELKKAEIEAGLWPGDFSAKPGITVLDQLHQSMILFGAGRSEAVKRLLVDEGVGQNQLFWRLAQSLSALYPPSSEEKRWVDGVLGRKKGLGL